MVFLLKVGPTKHCTRCNVLLSAPHLKRHWWELCPTCCGINSDSGAKGQWGVSKLRLVSRQKRHVPFSLIERTAPAPTLGERCRGRCAQDLMRKGRLTRSFCALQEEGASAPATSMPTSPGRSGRTWPTSASSQPNTALSKRFLFHLLEHALNGVIHARARQRA